MNLKNLHPLFFILFYVVLYFVVAVFLVTAYDYGGLGIQLLVQSVKYLFYGILVITLLLIVFKLEWTKRNWVIVIFLILIGLLPVFVNLLAEEHI